MIRLRLLAAVIAVCGVLALGGSEARGDPGRAEPDTLLVHQFRFTAVSEAVNALWNDVVATVPGNACTQYASYVDMLDLGLVNAITPHSPWRPGVGVGPLLSTYPGQSAALAGIQEIVSGCFASGVSAVDHCFRFQIDTPGRMVSNPDPGVVGVETWFWLEGLLAGDQSPNPPSNRIPRLLESSTQSSGTWTWSETDPGRPMTDGVWLLPSRRLHTIGIGNDRCETGNVGRLLDPTVRTGGDYRALAEQNFRPMLNAGSATYSLVNQSVAYTIDTANLVYEGDLELGPYSWLFKDGSSSINLSWSDGGAGEAPPSGPNPDYSLYTGSIRHTYGYHGNFGVIVQITRSLTGDFRYDYIERYTYDENWSATQIAGNWPWGSTSWSARCPVAASYRLAPTRCATVESREYVYERRAADPPPPGVTSCRTSYRWGYDYGSGVGYSFTNPGSADCNYGRWYEVNRWDQYRYAWNDYHECRDSGGSAVTSSTIDSATECFEQHEWIAPTESKTVPLDGVIRDKLEIPLDHSHDPGYGAPRFGYPVRRITPVLIPNP